MKKCKKIFQEKIILSFVMCILLCIVLFSVTTAWYSANNTAVTHGMELAEGSNRTGRAGYYAAARSE